MHKRFAFLCLYPSNTAPSQRFRIEQFLPYWKEEGIEIDLFPFYSDVGHKVLYQKGKLAVKAWEVVRSYLRRIYLLFCLSAYDTVIVQRSVTPLGPPVIEFLLVKLLGKKLIYDFDDAIWMPDSKSSFLVKAAKFYPKVRQICRLATVVIVGNTYLSQYAKQFSRNVRVIPTVVDTENKYIPNNPITPTQPITIGWTGSHTTLQYLDIISAPLAELARWDNVRVLIIANKPAVTLSVPHDFEYWSADSEIAKLNEIDIGIMPLRRDRWSEGKCGFKAIQYMAMEKPVVASPIGVNNEIIDPGVSGFLPSTNDEWLTSIGKLIADVKLRREMGKEARSRIVANYSVTSVLPKWKEVFRAL